ncbi:hypothetical protein DFH29DRAFT_761566, partial [Suillus ampliporus]
QLRATEGWAALQHHNVLRTYFTVYPPDSNQEMTEEVDPRLHAECLQGAYFSILPGDETVWTKHVPEWHMGNVYALECAPIQFISLLMSPCRDKVTRYQVLLCPSYEVKI